MKMHGTAEKVHPQRQAARQIIITEINPLPGQVQYTGNLPCTDAIHGVRRPPGVSVHFNAHFCTDSRNQTRIKSAGKRYNPLRLGFQGLSDGFFHQRMHFLKQFLPTSFPSFVRGFNCMAGTGSITVFIKLGHAVRGYCVHILEQRPVCQVVTMSEQQQQTRQ